MTAKFSGVAAGVRRSSRASTVGRGWRRAGGRWSSVRNMCVTSCEKWSGARRGRCPGPGGGSAGHGNGVAEEKIGENARPCSRRRGQRVGSLYGESIRQGRHIRGPGRGALTISPTAPSGGGGGDAGGAAGQAA